METSLLKKDLLEKIAATEDVGLLELLHHNYEHFTNPKYANAFLELSPENRAELIGLLEEDDNENIATNEEYMEATSRWRTK
jgi:hypothetical protein